MLIGLFSGGVLAAATGARRTATAYPRFLDVSRAEHLLLSPAETGLGAYYDNLGAHPDVETSAVLGGAALFPLGPDGEPEFTTNVFMPIDGRFLTEVDRPRMIAGRVPRATEAREVLVNPVAAERYDVGPGSRLEMVALSFPSGQTDEGEPVPSPFEVTVTGVGVIAPDIVPTTKLDSSPTFVTSPAFYKRFVPSKVTLAYDGIAIRLEPGRNLALFRQTAQALATSFGGVGDEIFVGEQSDRTRKVERAIQPQAFALGAFAAFAGLAGFLVLGQALARQLTLDATEVPILRTLGMTRAQLAVLNVLRGAVVAGAAALVAVGTAIALSPLAPIGAARQAEVSPGIEVNAAWLAAGAALVVALFVARAVPPALRLARVAAGVHGAAELGTGARPSALGRLAGDSGLPPAAVTGVRMALEPGHGRGAVPVRATLAGALIALAAVTTALTFAASLDRLVSTPRLFGRTWDVVIDGQFGAIPRARVEPVLEDSPIVAAFSGGFYGEASVGGQAVTAIGLTNPAVGPTLVEGRGPRRDNEVVLGTSTLDRSDSAVGQMVEVTLGKVSRAMRVVGRAVFPGLGRGGFPQTGLGDGVWTTAKAVEPPPDPEAGGEPYLNFWLVRSRAGASEGEKRALEARFAEVCGPDCVAPGQAVIQQQPAEIATLDRVRWTPIVLAAVLALLAVATLGQTLVTSIRRRRRDLAVLKTLGFRRVQISATVAWQATTLAALAALAGLPIGVVIGRLAWRALGEQFGIVPEPATPVLALLVAFPITVVLANVIALAPGLMAARVRAAVALRAE